MTSADPGSTGISLFRAEVRESWQRCLDEYRLDPDRVPRSELVTSRELRQQTEPYEDLMAVSQREIESLFRRLVDNDYIVSIAAPDGLKLSLRCDQHFLGEMTNFGVLPGSVWREECQGTNGIGTALRMGRAISINGSDHFSIHNKALSCHAAPVFGQDGAIDAMLNVTCAHDEDARTARLVLDLLRRAAARIEQRYFTRRNSHLRLLRLSSGVGDDLADLGAQIALDSDGRVRAVTSGYLEYLGLGQHAGIIGQRLDGLIDLPPNWDDPARSLPVVNAAGAGSVILSHVQTAPARMPRPVVPSAFSGSVVQSPDRFHCYDSGLMVALEKAEKLFRARVPILITGDTGTGKSLIAHHLAGIVSAQVWKITCGELGSEGPIPIWSGSDGSAYAQVILLESLGDLSPRAQARILALIGDDGELKRRGIYIIGTSTETPDEMVRKGTLREDIAFRVAGTLLSCPRLRAYGDLDAQIYASFQKGFGAPVTFTPDVAAVLKNHHWPGNLRELDQVVQVARTLSEGNLVRLEHLPEHLIKTLVRENMTARSQSESVRIEAALKYHGGNVTETARYLGMSRSTLYRKVAIDIVRSGLPDAEKS